VIFVLMASPVQGPLHYYSDNKCENDDEDNKKITNGRDNTKKNPECCLLEKDDAVGRWGEDEDAKPRDEQYDIGEYNEDNVAVAEGEGENYTGFSFRSDKGVDSKSDVKNRSQPQTGAFRVPGIGRQDDSEWDSDDASSMEDNEDVFCPNHGASDDDDDDDDDDDKTNLPMAYAAELVERRSTKEVVLAHAQIDTTRHLIQVLLLVCSLVLVILVILLPIMLLVVRQNDNTPDADNVGAASHTRTSPAPSQFPSQTPSQAPTMDSCPGWHMNFSNGFACNASMNLELGGDATCKTTTLNETHSSSGGLIRLTGNSSQFQIGTAFVPFFFPDCNSDFSFTWQVQYHIDEPGGDGITLVLHQDLQGMYAYSNATGSLGVYRNESYPDELISYNDTMYSGNYTDDYNNTNDQIYTDDNIYTGNDTIDDNYTDAPNHTNNYMDDGNYTDDANYMVDDTNGSNFPFWEPSFIANALVIEMDLNLNREYGDEIAPAVHVVLADDAGNWTTLIETPALLMTKTKAANTLWVEYDGRNSRLHIYLNNHGEALTSVNIPPLTDIFVRKEIYVGFTASTGGLFANQDILSFHFYG